MYKYNMIIDGESYLALFADHMEAADFLDACDNDGSEVIVNGFSWETAEQVLADPDFEQSYRIECAASILVPNHRDYPKVSQLEDQLRLLGHIA